MAKLELILAVIASLGIGAHKGFEYVQRAKESDLLERAEFDSAPVIDHILPSCVTILRENKLNPFEGKVSIGAGVIVKAVANEPLQIITANHVATEIEHLDGFAKIMVNQKTIILRKVSVWHRAPDLDLAILVTDTVWAGPDIAMRMSKFPPRRGDFLWAVGAPGGADWNVTMGVISNRVACANSNGSCYRTNAILTFGNSGGGVFNADGTLIGIASYVRVDQVIDQKGVTHSLIVDGQGGIVSWHTVKQYLRSADVTLPKK